MAVWLTPRALSASNPPPSFGIWVPAFAGMSGSKIEDLTSPLARPDRPSAARPRPEIHGGEPALGSDRVKDDAPRRRDAVAGGDP